MRPCFVCALVALALLASGCVAAAPPVSGGRIRPPAGLACDINHLTSWFGVVSGYKRGLDRTWIQIDTDYDTVESTTIEHPGAPDASAHYRYRGQPFTARDFAKIESKPGTLRKGMRATAWVCDDGKTPPMIDWQAAAE